MILADTNFWLALSLSRHDFHATTREWFAAQAAAGSVLFCRSTQQSFLRLLTTDAVMRPYGIPAMTNAQAWAVYQGLQGEGRCGFAREPDDVEPHWQRFAERNAASPKLWMDAYLAAFARAGGHQLVTTDRAFTQFADLHPIVLSR